MHHDVQEDIVLRQLFQLFEKLLESQIVEALVFHVAQELLVDQQSHEVG